MATSSKVDSGENKTEAEAVAPANQQKSAANAQRKIPGNLPYLAASGTLKKALDRLVEASRPDRFNTDFLENVLKLTGGAARATIPLMKRMGLLASDGTPTDLYARFRTESGRGPAALQALRTGFPEIFKRSEYAHSVEDAKLRDIIVEITGLKPSDPVAVAIKSTFNVVKSYIPSGMDPNSVEDDLPSNEDSGGLQLATPGPRQIRTQSSVGLINNINIVIPETSDVRILNAIFKSIKENLLQ